ncbi:hypothetical protein QTP88_015344 [Uroleucon formosanum]
MIEMVVYIIVVVLVMVWCYIKWQNRHFEKLAAKMQGPTAYPIIGTGYTFFDSSEQVTSKIIDLVKEYNLLPIKLWLGPYFAVTICKPEDLQLPWGILFLETTMGYNLDTQSNKKDREFGEAIVIKKKKDEFDQRKKAISAKVDLTGNKDENQSKIFLDMLFELNNNVGNFSDSDIRDEVVTMMIAGSETSAITICFCHLMLAIDQDIQDKVYNEIYDIFGDSDETITMEDTTRLVYLEQVLKEILRMYPAAPLLLREIQGDLKIFSNNYILPKGTTCVIPILATHYSPDLYPNPWSFNPENFSPENIAKRHKYSFIAFSGGPRGCIGSKYAMFSMKVTVSTFLRHFSVHTDIKLADIKLKIDLLMRSVHGYPVTIRPRMRTPIK